MYGRDEKCTQILVRKPKGMILYGRPRHTWEDNIRADLREMGGKV